MSRSCVASTRLIDEMIVPLSRKGFSYVADPLGKIDGSLLHLKLFKHETHEGYSGRSAIRQKSKQSNAVLAALLHEQGRNHQAIERQLAHAERNVVSSAYNGAKHLPERRKMLEEFPFRIDTRTPFWRFRPPGLEATPRI